MSKIWDAGLLRVAEGEWVIQQVTPPMDDLPSEVWVFKLDGITVPPRTLAQYFIDDVVAQSDLNDGYVIEERIKKTEWGFSGAVWELTISVIAAIVGTGAYDLIKARAATAVAERRQLPLMRDDALAAAKHALALHYKDVSADDLELTSEASSHGGLVWTLGMRTDRAEFEWQTDRRDGFPATRIRRTHRSV